MLGAQLMGVCLTGVFHPLSIWNFITSKFTTSVFTWYGEWFFGALFTARIFYWIAYRTTAGKTLGMTVITLLFALSGISLAHWHCGFNLLWYHQGLMFCMYIWIGSLLKKYEINTKAYLALGVLYLISYVVFKIRGWNFYNCGMYTEWSPLYLPISIWHGLSGSCLVFAIARMLEHNRVLSFIGRNSTTWYAVNGITNSTIVITLYFIKPIKWDNTLLFVTIVSSVVIAYSVIITFLLSLKYFRFLKGEF